MTTHSSILAWKIPWPEEPDGLQPTGLQRVRQDWATSILFYCFCYKLITKEESEKVGLKLNIQKTKIMASGPITSWQIEVETVYDFIFLGSQITADGDCSHEIKRHLLLGRKVMTNQDSILKSRDIVNKGLSSQCYGFSNSHVWMWELDYKESWVLKNWCFWTVVLEKTWESLGLQGDPTSPS